MRRFRIFSILTLLATGLLTAGFRNIPYLSADEVMQKVKDTHGADAEIDVIQMTTVAENDTSPPATTTLLSVVQKDAKGNSRYLLRVLAPEKYLGTSFLVIEKDGGDSDQWIYLPAEMDKPKAISGAGRSGSFLGSDFSYEDLRKEKPGEWTYDKLEDEKVDGTLCYVIMATPADLSREKATGYTYRFIYVDEATYDIRRIELLDSNKKITKEFDAYDYQPTNNGTQRPRSGVMTNFVKHTHTVMTLLSSRLNKPLDDKFFSLDTIQHWGPDQDKLFADLLPKPPAKTP